MRHGGCARKAEAHLYCRDQDKNQESRALLGSTNVSGCKVDAGASNALTHLFSAEAGLFLLLTTAAGPAGVPRDSYDPCR